jgi:hypothetical protein
MAALTNDIPLEQFINFTLTTGMQRVELVRMLALGDDKRRDFWGPIRKAIQELHEEPLVVPSLEKLETYLAGLVDLRHKQAYPAVIDGYRKFFSAAEVSSFMPPRTVKPIGPLGIGVAPDLGLVIDGHRYFVCLHFGFTPCGAKRVKATLHLLADALGSLAPGATAALLDVRRAKLHTTKAPNPRMGLLLRAEATAFAALRDAI